MCESVSVHLVGVIETVHLVSQCVIESVPVHLVGVIETLYT